MQQGLPLHHVARPRLVDRLVGAPCAIIEAGGGYGKSVLIAEVVARTQQLSVVVEIAPWHDEPQALAAAFATAAVSSGIAVPDLDESPEAVVRGVAESIVAAGAMLVVDDAHHLSPAGTALLVQLARWLAGKTPLLIAARRLPDAAEPLRVIAGVASLSGRDLALDRNEIGVLAERFFTPLALDQADVLHAITEGWTAACVIALMRLGAAVNIDQELQRLRSAPRAFRLLIDEVHGRSILSYPRHGFQSAHCEP